jgi:hypothetical protein
MSFEFPDLQRPQYPSSPEVLLAALAWSVVPRSEAHKKTGLIYQRREASTSRGKPKKVNIEQTIPRGEALEAFRMTLEKQGMHASGGTLPPSAAEAVADALLGAQPRKGVGRSSSAIGIAGALLQDAIGGLATEDPPNFAQMLNTMHSLGGIGGTTAAERWFDVASRHASLPQLSAIESALAASTLKPFLASVEWPPKSPILAELARPKELPMWWQNDVIGSGVGTPFSWFRLSWDRLCEAGWQEVLPPRRWAAWAVCLLRNALGFGYLWEANFYFEIARGVFELSRSAETVAQWALCPTKPLVPYPKGGIAQMDVMPSIKQLLGKGLACRKAIIQATESLKSSPSSLSGFVEALRTEASNDSRKSIRAALAGSGEKGGLSNLEETVRYALVARESADVPDHSSLLRVVSRNYTHVVPGPEWIVVMSAMAAAHPSAVVRLGDVRQSLSDLGFKPRIDFLLAELERAGLCLGAPDGDEGIEINLGFSKK